MILQALGLIDILAAILLLFKLENPIAMFFALLLLLKGVGSFVPIFPPFEYLTVLMAIIDILAAILILVAFGFAGGLSNLLFIFYLGKGLWTLVFGFIFS
jgi:hypothetical protein